MTKQEIIAELPTLSPQDRFEIRMKIVEMDDDGQFDDDDALTPEQMAMIDSRMAEYARNSSSAIPLDEFKSRILRRIK